MTGDPASTDKDWKLPLLHDAVAALEAGDIEGFEMRMHELAQRREDELAHGVVRIVTRLHEVIHQLDIESQLRCFADRDIPDVTGHLDQVVRLTEKAAHQTLDLVDESRDLVNELTRRHASLLTTDDPEGGEALRALTDGLRGKLSAMAQAQEYQDISGQLIGRAVRLVRDVEAALLKLLKLNGREFKIETPAPMSGTASPLLGPAARGSVSQQDADDLLADLGF